MRSFILAISIARMPYDNKWAPLVADIYPNGNNADGSPRMEIITGANTSRTTTYTSFPAVSIDF